MYASILSSCLHFISYFYSASHIFTLIANLNMLLLLSTIPIHLGPLMLIGTQDLLIGRPSLLPSSNCIAVPDKCRSPPVQRSQQDLSNSLSILLVVPTSLSPEERNNLRIHSYSHHSCQQSKQAQKRR